MQDHLQHPLPEPDLETIRRCARLLQPLLLYHRYTVVGMEHLPRTGPALIAFHHSFATYDGFLMGLEMWRQTGRLGRGLGDKRIFQTPGLDRLAVDIGLVPASPEAGARLLADGHLLGVAPGGMWESLRPREERYKVRWAGRLGFCRLALRAQVPLLVTACPRADDVFTLYSSRLTDAIYQRLHLPLPLLRGLGFSTLPRPIRLTQYLSRPILPPPHDPERPPDPEQEDEQVKELHRKATLLMEDLLARR